MNTNVCGLGRSHGLDRSASLPSRNQRAIVGPGPRARRGKTGMASPTATRPAPRSLTVCCPSARALSSPLHPAAPAGSRRGTERGAFTAAYTDRGPLRALRSALREIAAHLNSRGLRPRAARKRKPISCVRMPRSRAREPVWHEIYTTLRGAICATALKTSRAPTRGGSNRTWSNPPRIHGIALSGATDRSATWNSALAMPLSRALARARPMRPASPSTPTTSRARRAIGSVKLPSPQYRSSTRSSARSAVVRWHGRP
jgi:hypothetical protein